MTKNRKQNTNEKEKTLQTVLSARPDDNCHENGKRKDSEGPSLAAAVLRRGRGTQDRGQWKVEGEGEGEAGRKPQTVQNYENSYLCTHTWREICNVAGTTCHSGWQAEQSDPPEICMRQWDAKKKQHRQLFREHFRRLPTWFTPRVINLACVANILVATISCHAVGNCIETKRTQRRSKKKPRAGDAKN